MLLLALLLLFGALIGQVRIGGVSLGAAAVLFVALGFTAWAGTQGVELALPEVIGSFGLILFTYTIGLSSGPSFFASLKRGWPIILGTVGALGVAAAAAIVAGRLLGVSKAVAAGTFAGALTNTPALAAAGQAVGDAELPAVGYSISYLWGVLGMLLAAMYALSRKDVNIGNVTVRLKQETIHIDLDNPPQTADILERYPAVSVNRVTRAGEPVEVALPERQLQRDDLISVVGSREAVAQLVDELGHVSKIDIIGDRKYLDSNRITLSVEEFSGKRIEELELLERFGAHVSRVRRGDQDMIVDEDFRVQIGDRIRVVAPRDKIVAVRTYLGDSERGFSDINPAALALGLTLGVLLGVVPFPLPTGTFSLGSAAGTLMVGLVFGRMGRIGRFPVRMPTTAAQTLSSIGMLTFLAYAGTKAGGQFIGAVTSDLGLKIFILGFIVTCAAAVSLLVLGKLQGTNSVQLSGQLAGAQTQPAVLAFANTRTEFDNRVALGYAMVYPAAMVAKILLAQVVALV